MFLITKYLIRVCVGSDTGEFQQRGKLNNFGSYLATDHKFLYLKVDEKKIFGIHAHKNGCTNSGVQFVQFLIKCLQIKKKKVKKSQVHPLS